VSFRERPGVRIAVLASVGLIVSFMQTVAVPLLPHLPELLHASPADTSWVLTSTLLAAAIASPVAGRLGDLYGKRRILLVLISLVLVGSVVLALSTSLPPALVGRTLQGCGLSAIPLGVSILRDILPPERLPQGIALVSASLGIGGALFLPLAAIAAGALDWHWLFAFVALVCALALAAVLLVVPPVAAPGGRFDLPGALLFGLGLLGVLLPLAKSSEWGWTPGTIALLAGGVVVLIGWGALELRRSAPLIDLRVAGRRTVLLTNLTGFGIGFGTFLVFGSLPILLQAPASSEIGLGLDFFPAALCLTPLGGVMFVSAPIAGRLIGRIGPRPVLVTGISLTLVACLLGLVIFRTPLEVALVAAAAGAGIGLASSAMPALIMRAVPVGETGAANGLNALLRTVGSSVAATLVGAVIGASAQVVDGVASPTLAGHLTMFAIGVGISAGALSCAIAIPRHEPRHPREVAALPEPPPGGLRA